MVDQSGGLYRGHGEDYYSTRDHCLFSRLSACGLHSTMTDLEDSRRRIAELQLEHRGLDAMIEAIGQQTRFDELQLRRLKKRKLALKDRIIAIEHMLSPDERA